MKLILDDQKCGVCGKPATIYRLADSPCGVSQWFCEEHYEQVNAMNRDAKGDSPIPTSVLQELLQWIDLHDIQYDITKLASDILTETGNSPTNTTSIIEGWHLANQQFREKINETLTDRQKSAAEAGKRACKIAKSKRHKWDKTDLIFFSSFYCIMTVVGLAVTKISADSYYSSLYYGSPGAEIILVTGLFSSLLSATTFVMIFVEGHNILKRIKEQEKESTDGCNCNKNSELVTI
jgi:uncharacterized membrane protein